MDERFLHRAQGFAGALFRLLFGLEVEGSERIPRTGPVIVACNHISEMDPPVLGSAIPRTVHFMAKSELFAGRLRNRFFRMLRAFPVNRRGLDRTAIETACGILGGGGLLVMFPEGTRSRDGIPLPPRAGIGLIASRTGARIVPAFISGTDDIAGALSRRERFRVAFGAPVGRDRIARTGAAGGFRAVAELVMDRITETGAAVSAAAPRKRGNRWARRSSASD